MTWMKIIKLETKFEFFYIINHGVVTWTAWHKAVLLEDLKK